MLRGQRGLSDSAPSRWLGLFVITRAAGVLVIPPLFLLQDLEASGGALALLAIGYALGSGGLVLRSTQLQRSPAFWTGDCMAVLGLVMAFGHWRSPFYLLALSALILPATGLPLRRAVAFGAGYVLAYFGVALLTGVDWDAIATSARLQTFGALLLVPLIVTVVLAFAADLLRSLEAERRRSEGLALEAERKRIAWELHDSAKQRIHVAHLLLSSVATGDGETPSPVELAADELRAATADMDTSLRDLREPRFDGGSLEAALSQWAARLEAGCDVDIEVVGDAPALPPAIVTQVYRVGREALTNVVRHAGASRATVVLQASAERLQLAISDDGSGMPDRIRCGAAGLRSMRNRAEALGGELEIRQGDDGRGTVVLLDVPVTDVPGTP